MSTPDETLDMIQTDLRDAARKGAPTERPASPPPQVIPDETIRKWRDPGVPSSPPTAAERAEWRKDAERWLPGDFAVRLLRLLDALKDAEDGRDEQAGYADVWRHMAIALGWGKPEAAERARTPATTAPSDGAPSLSASDQAWLDAQPPRTPAEPSADAAGVKLLADEHADASHAHGHSLALDAGSHEALSRRTRAARHARDAAIDKLAAERGEARNEVRVLRDAIDRQAARAASDKPDWRPRAFATPAAHHDGEEDALAVEVDMVQERGEGEGRLPDASSAAEDVPRPPVSGVRCPKCFEPWSVRGCEHCGFTWDDGDSSGATGDVIAALRSHNERLLRDLGGALADLQRLRGGLHAGAARAEAEVAALRADRDDLDSQLQDGSLFKQDGRWWCYYDVDNVRRIAQGTIPLEAVRCARSAARAAARQPDAPGASEARG